MPAAAPEVPAKRRTRLRVNPIRCVAFGFCAEYAPELFALDEWGYPLVHQQQLLPEQIALAGAAARRCPVRAILLEQQAVREGKR